VRPTAPATLTSAADDVRWAEAHAGGVQALCVSADGKLLLSGGLDETLRLWDPGRLQEVGCLPGDVGPVTGLALEPGGNWAASCALRLFKRDMAVQLWDLPSGRERRRLRGHDRKIQCVAVAPDGRRVASGSADRTIRIWALDAPGSPVLCLQGHADEVRSLVFLPGGNSLLSGGYDGIVRLWDTRTGAAKGSLPVQAGKIEALAFSGSSSRLAIAGGTLRLRQADGKLTTLSGHRGPVLCLAFSPDGQWLLSGGSDGSVRQWRVADGREVRRLEGHRDQVQAVVFSPSGQVAFSGGRDGSIRRWPIPTA
jgi:WD40 repeat protein